MSAPKTTTPTKALRTSGTAGDCFGCSIALRGSTAFIGASGKLGGTGGAYVFTGAGSSWTLQQQFAGTASNGYFGSAVGLSSNGLTAVVGAPGTSTSTGQAFVYTSSGTAWSQQATLASGVTGDSFGFSVAVDGSLALIGAYGANGNQGAAYVFTTAGIQQAVLQASGTTNFGWSVALSGATALVGAYELASGPGAAYAFTKSGGTWSQGPAFNVPVGSQDFGYAVALSSNTAVVGAFGESNAGGAYIYAPAAVTTAPALGATGTVCLSLGLLGAAFWAMTRRRGRWAIAIGLSIAANACSDGANWEPGGVTDTPTATQGPPIGAAGSSGDMGSVGMQLTLPGGEQVNTIQWAITGPNGATTVVQSSSITVQALAIHFLVGNIPAGSGYQVTLSGTSADSGVTCTGSAQFSVAAHATTLVSVRLACGVVGMGGRGTDVNGMTFNCAAWTSVTANPSQIKVGSAIAVAATASGPDPSMLTYTWSSSTGSFSSPNAETSNFTCTQAGPPTLTLTVGDGPVPAGSTCNPTLDTDQIAVTCGPGTPPTAAPAVPPWGLLILAASVLGMGLTFAKRASGRPEIG